MVFGFSRPKIEHLDRYLAQKDYDKALEAVADELKNNPSQFNLLLRQAEILGLAGNRQQAIRLYREIAEKYARDGFYAKAIALYKKVVRLDPSLDEVHAELARLIEEDKASHLPLAARLAAAQQPKDEPRPASDPDFESRQRESAQQIKELEASTMFSSFGQDVLEEILSCTALRSYDQGDIIVTEGERGSSLFLIVSGEVKVFTRGESGEHLQLAELGPGDFFGEVSLLTGKPRTATITAKSQVSAIELGKDDVDRIAVRHPQVRQVLEEFYQRRALETVEAVIRRLRDQG